MSERARAVLERVARPVLDEPDVLELLAAGVLVLDVAELVPVLPSMLDVPLVLGDVVLLGDALVLGELLLLGCESSTSPPEVLVVPRCKLAPPDDGTQLLDMLMLAPVLLLVLGVTPVPLAPFVVLSPVYR